MELENLLRVDTLESIEIPNPLLSVHEHSLMYSESEHSLQFAITPTHHSSPAH